jgi:hypothetical protein
MPIYRVVTFIISEWACEFETSNEQEARDKAYAEVEPDIPPNGYVEQSSSLVSGSIAP